MTRKNVENFLEEALKDKDLRRRIRDASENIIRIAKEKGYEFTRDELKDVLEERWGLKREKKDEWITWLSEPPGF